MTWKPITVQELYKQCLSKGHKPHVIRATFNLIYVYCQECQRIYRIHTRKIDYCNKNEWTGKPINGE